MKRADVARALSDELLVLASPFRAYAEMARHAGDPGGGRALARRIATFLFVVAMVGTVTATGRFPAPHVLSIAIAWSFVPVLHFATVAAMSRAYPTRMPVVRAVELHMAGNGPWYALFLGLSGIVVLSPDVPATFRALFASRILFVALGLALAGGAVTSYAFYRSCAGATRRRALLLLLIEWLLKIALCLVWYGWIDNLAPQFLGARGPG